MHVTELKLIAIEVVRKSRSLGKSIRDLTDSQIRGVNHILFVLQQITTTSPLYWEGGREGKITITSKVFSKQGS